MNIIIINTGGQVFQTNETTLSAIPDTYFIDMLKTKPYADGSYFIDRNKAIFEEILDFLRDGSIYIPEDTRDILKLKQEALFYKLHTIVQQCDQALQAKQNVIL
uniref:BTB domain-containing protein n=1 Tax=Arcella intermedia TaxID=1963864 RepID=A0A6B2LUW2_9EUKA